MARRFLKQSILLFVFSYSALLNAGWHRVSEEVMTTKLDIEFWAESASIAKEASREVLNRFEQIEARMSRYRDDSELSFVNRFAAEKAVSISQELFLILEKSVQISVLSQGAFDITFASVGHLYDYRNNKKPNDLAIGKGIHALDYRHISLNKAENSVRFKEQGVLLDLGGIAKGYAVDEGIKVLRSYGINHARLSAGGDMYLLGSKLNKPWIVAVRDPRNDEKNSVVLPLVDVALSTSGDYERYFIDESGERVHHIISPKTGKSANGLMSVSVLGPDATTTDALSTAIFVLGLSEGMNLVNKLPGIDAILIDDNRKVYYSEGLGRNSDLK